MDPLIFPKALLEMPEFYRELSQYLWFNKHIKIGNNSVDFSHFSNHGINFSGNSVDINGKYKLWDTVKYEYSLTSKEKF